MRWNKEAPLPRPFHFSGIALAVSLGLLLALSADEKQLTVVTPQDHFSVAVQQREGKEYVDLQNVLDSMGHSSATVEGENFKLHYGRVEAHFQSGEAAANVGATTVQLGGKFQLDNGRGWVPVSSLTELLPALT